MCMQQSWRLQKWVPSSVFIKWSNSPSPKTTNQQKSQQKEVRLEDMTFGRIDDDDANARVDMPAHQMGFFKYERLSDA